MASIIKVDTIQDATGAFEHARLVQMVNVLSNAASTGTTLIPADDTIPQNTEGDQVMTLAITPTHASNKLKIEVTAFVCDSHADSVNMALFQDSDAGALAATEEYQGDSNAPLALVLCYYMTTGTTSSTTFKVRVGSASASTTTFNGNSGTRRFGDIPKSSITISEIRV